MVYYPTLIFDDYDEFVFNKNYSGFIDLIAEYNNDEVVCFGKISIDISDNNKFSIHLLLQDIYCKLPLSIPNKEFISTDNSNLLFKYNSIYFLLNWTISDSLCSIAVIPGSKYIIDDKGIYIIYDDEDEAATVVSDDYIEYDSDEEHIETDLVIIN